MGLSYQVHTIRKGQVGQTLFQSKSVCNYRMISSDLSFKNALIKKRYIFHANSEFFVSTDTLNVRKLALPQLSTICSVVIFKRKLFCQPSKPWTQDRRNLNLHKAVRRSPGRLLNILYTFNVRPVFKDYIRCTYNANASL